MKDSSTALSVAITDIIAERRRQQSVKDFSAQDDTYVLGNWRLAISYIEPMAAAEFWPSDWHDNSFKPSDYRRNLVKLVLLSPQKSNASIVHLPGGETVKNRKARQLLRWQISPLVAISAPFASATDVVLFAIVMADSCMQSSQSPAHGRTAGTITASLWRTGHEQTSQSCCIHRRADDGLSKLQSR
jgi:hypothetical protein